MQAISNIGLFAALLAGMISFLSPCVLPLVPGYVAYISGSVGSTVANQNASRSKTILAGLLFVLGFSSVFIALGASATFVGQLLLSWRYQTNILGGLLVALFGLFMTGLVPMQWMERDIRYHGPLAQGDLFGPFVLGVAFGFGWTPCIGPVLGAILTVGAMSSTVSAGIILLSAYAIGLGIPFLLAAAFTESLMHRLKSFRRIGRVLKIFAGAVMIVLGLAMADGYMQVMSYWMLEHVTIFTRLG